MPPLSLRGVSDLPTVVCRRGNEAGLCRGWDASAMPLLLRSQVPQRKGKGSFQWSLRLLEVVVLYTRL